MFVCQTSHVKHDVYILYLGSYLQCCSAGSLDFGVVADFIGSEECG